MREQLEQYDEKYVEVDDKFAIIKPVAVNDSYRPASSLAQVLNGTTIDLGTDFDTMNRFNLNRKQRHMTNARVHAQNNDSIYTYTLKLLLLSLFIYLG